MVQYFASNFTFFICLSWMLPYLKKQYHLGNGDAVSYAMAPLLLGATSQWIAGWMVDRLYRSRWRAWSRRIPGIAGFALSAAGVLAIARAGSPVLAVLYFTLAAFGADMTVSPSWVYCTDIAGKNVGGISGAMNMFGNIGSFVSATAFPYLQGLTGSASAYFVVAAALNLAGIWCWFRMRSVDLE
jgi:ACS family glucarate transporter-like MFS transporter